MLLQVANNHSNVVAEQKQYKQVDHASHRDVLLTVSGQQRLLDLVMWLNCQWETEVLELLFRIFNIFDDTLERLKISALKLGQLSTLLSDETDGVAIFALLHG
jgi:hypothetical protein